MIRLNFRSKKLILLQRNELLSKKQKWLRKKFGRLIFSNLFIYFFNKKNIEKKVIKTFQSEFNTFKNFLPNKAEHIMDLGCGLGVINIFLNQFYKNNSYFYLLDKNKIDSKIKYGFNKNYESYNKLENTKKILKNNINHQFVNFIDVDKKFTIKSNIDLILSLKSMGYHYPFEIYLQMFRKCCTYNTVFIFDISSKNYHESDFYKYFEVVKVIYTEESIQPLKRLFCKNFKILNKN